MAGKFTGTVNVTWLSNTGADRDMKLTSGFSYTGPDGTKWNVPKGAVVNGASIPRIFWTTFGPPFIGDYRRASVVHDYFCGVRVRTEFDTHRMFRDACVTGGVAATTADTMYAAVKTFGPHWKIPAGLFSKELGEPAKPRVAIPQVRLADENDYLDLKQWIEREQPSLEEIDERIDEMAPLVTLLGAAETS